MKTLFGILFFMTQAAFAQISCDGSMDITHYSCGSYGDVIVTSTSAPGEMEICTVSETKRVLQNEESEFLLTQTKDVYIENLGCSYNQFTTEIAPGKILVLSTTCGADVGFGTLSETIYTVLDESHGYSVIDKGLCLDED